MNNLEYDIVIATRNRKYILDISIPLMLAQNIIPKNLIVVDSSDEPREVKNIIEKNVLKSNNNINLNIIHTNPGSSYQRNIGLKYAMSPIVFFPDDDSLWHQGVAEFILKIYEKDKEKTIGAVCGDDFPLPPKEVIDKKIKLPYRMEFKDASFKFQQNLYGKYLDKIFPDPLFLTDNFGCWKQKLPNWLDDENAVLSGPMTGFRMTFRTELIKQIGFDESLGRYSLFEDRDASLGILQNYYIVCAKNAKIFHYRDPMKRTDGREFGVMHILNRSYVVCKYSQRHSKQRKMLRPYLIYKILRYFFQCYSSYGRYRLMGAIVALRKVSILLNTEPDDVQKKYIELRKYCIKLLNV